MGFLDSHATTGDLAHTAYAKCCAQLVELITISLVTILSIWHKVCVRLFVLQNFDRTLANPVAPPTDRTVKCLVRCKVHLVL